VKKRKKEKRIRRNYIPKGIQKPKDKRSKFAGTRGKPATWANANTRVPQEQSPFFQQQPVGKLLVLDQWAP
jgi:hypothetical protein